MVVYNPGAEPEKGFGLGNRGQQVSTEALLVCAKQAARLLGISYGTMRNRRYCITINGQAIPPFRVGGRVRYRRADIQRVLDAR